MWLPALTHPDRARSTSIRASRASRALAVLSVSVFALGLAPASAQDDLSATNCSNIVKNITASDGSSVTVNIAGADCSGGGAKLRVTYFWLDDVATGHILSGYLPPALRQALGRDYPVIRNTVFNEVKSLFERFGRDIYVPNSEEFFVSTCFATGERDQYGEIQACGENESDTYRRERRGRPTNAVGVKRLPLLDFFVPLPVSEDVLANTREWPDDFDFYYGWDGDADEIEDAARSGERISMPDVRLWRPARPNDIGRLRQRMRAYAKGFVEGEVAGLKIFGFPNRPAPTSASERQTEADNFLERGSSQPSSAQLLEFISRNSAAENSAIVYGTGATCGGGWQFRLAGPEFKLLIGVVENAGNETVSVDQINVWSSPQTELRPLAVVDTSSAQAWHEGTIRVPRPSFRPGEGVLIPMRIEFRADHDGYFQPSDGAAFDAIRALQPDTPLYFPDSEISKVASSFRPHSDAPDSTVFAYGPEITLREARAAGQEIALRQVDPTSVSLYVGFEVGSCPYVYGFDRGAGKWRLQSRAVVGATNRALAYEDSFALEHFDGRVRIVELEPEVSFLDDMVVDVTLADGTVKRLIPDDPLLEYRDNRNFILAYPDSVEISFPEFDEIEETIESAEVRIFGYYREFGVPLALVSNRVQGPACSPGRLGL